MADNGKRWQRDLSAIRDWLESHPENGTEERHEDRRDALQAAHELQLALSEVSP